MISFRGIKSAPSLASCGCEEGLGGTSTVRQEIFLDVIAVGLEQHVGAAQLANLFFGPLDHAVALARLLIEDLARGGHFEALLGARFGLHLGHFALPVSPPAKPAVAIVTIALHFACLICGRALSPENRYPLSGIMLLSTSPPPRQPLSAGRRARGLWQSRPGFANFPSNYRDHVGGGRPRRPFHLSPDGGSELMSGRQSREIELSRPGRSPTTAR